MASTSLLIRCFSLIALTLAVYLLSLLLVNSPKGALWDYSFENPEPCWNTTTSSTTETLSCVPTLRAHAATNNDKNKNQQINKKDDDSNSQATTNLTRTTTTTTSHTKQRRKVAIADGCYHVFLDLGSNIGVHGRFLMEPDFYQLSKLAVSLFEDEFGSGRDNRDFCIFAFEPNPQHYQRQTELAAAYAAMGWRYAYIPAGIGRDDESITFYGMARDAGQKDWGYTSLLASQIHKDKNKKDDDDDNDNSTANGAKRNNNNGGAVVYTNNNDCRIIQQPRKPKVGQGGIVDAEEEERQNKRAMQAAKRHQDKMNNVAVSNNHTVTVLRLSSWLQENIKNRQLPDIVYGTYNHSVTGDGPRVVVKMDIEGMEYKVLPDLLETGALCETVDFLFGEFHYLSHFFPLTDEKLGIVLTNCKEGQQYMKGLLDQFRALSSSELALPSFTEDNGKDDATTTPIRGQELLLPPRRRQYCKTTILSEDDETYLHDGKPFPTPGDFEKRRKRIKRRMRRRRRKGETK
jgi:hypothetical protein